MSYRCYIAGPGDERTTQPANSKTPPLLIGKPRSTGGDVGGDTHQTYCTVALTIIVVLCVSNVGHTVVLLLLVLSVCFYNCFCDVVVDVVARGSSGLC